jgi:hypothetical protein
MKKAAVFEETYAKYLSRLHEKNFADCSEILAVEQDNRGLLIPFFGKNYYVSSDGVVNTEGFSTPFAVKVVLCQYVLMCPEKLIVEQPVLVSYREFKDATPLISYFTTNTNKTLETAYSGKLEEFRRKCLDIGGIKQYSTAYDLSITFTALPRIPVVLNFNDQDDEFHAKCSILFYSDAQYYLDMECLAVTGTYLTELLL